LAEVTRVQGTPAPKISRLCDCWMTVCYQIQLPEFLLLCTRPATDSACLKVFSLFIGTWGFAKICQGVKFEKI